MIVLRPPSLQQAIDEYVSADDAFRQLPANATAEQVEKHVHALKVARETGNWEALLVSPDARPTKFVLDLKFARKVFRQIFERERLPTGTPGALGPMTLPALLVRLSLTSIVGASEELEIKREPDPKWGGWPLAQEDLVLQLDDTSPKIVGELGRAIWDRLIGPDPS